METDEGRQQPHLDSLLMTRISAPFSSFSRWLSVRKLSMACKYNKTLVLLKMRAVISSTASSEQYMPAKDVNVF
jgi:hypothetical protein